MKRFTDSSVPVVFWSAYSGAANEACSVGGMVKCLLQSIRYPERAKERRDLVLRLMMQQDVLTASQYETAVNRPLDSKITPYCSRQPAYFQQLKIELKDKVGGVFQSIWPGIYFS